MRAIPSLCLALFLTACATQTPVVQAPAQTAEVPADGGEMCGPGNEVAATLTGQFGERMVWMGLGPDGLSSLWLGPESWSWVTSREDGVVCIDRVGSRWHIRQPGEPA